MTNNNADARNERDQKNRLETAEKIVKGLRAKGQGARILDTERPNLGPLGGRSVRVLTATSEGEPVLITVYADAKIDAMAEEIIAADEVEVERRAALKASLEGYL